MASRTRFRNALLVVLSAANLVAVLFAAQAGEPWHATIHTALAMAFGLWAQHRMRLQEARSRAVEPDEESEVEIAELEEEVDALRRELGEMQERLDFAERVLSQSREADRLPPPEESQRRSDQHE